MHSLQDHLSQELEQAAEAKLKAALSEHNMTQEEAFSFADYDEKEGEKIGYTPIGVLPFACSSKTKVRL